VKDEKESIEDEEPTSEPLSQEQRLQIQEDKIKAQEAKIAMLEDGIHTLVSILPAGTQFFTQYGEWRFRAYVEDYHEKTTKVEIRNEDSEIVLVDVLEFVSDLNDSMQNVRYPTRF
jgi:hypothetical protein